MNLIKRMRGDRGDALAGLLEVAPVIAILWLLVAFIFGWPFQKTSAGEIALSYGAGPFEGAQYQKTVEPGSGIVNNGFFDKWYKYPATQRNYRASAEDTEDRDTGPVQAASKDRVQIGWEFVVNFDLNTNDMKRFHEDVGIKYKAYTSKGWDRMLAQTFKPVLTNALLDATREHTAADLYATAGTLKQVEEAVAQGLKDAINRAFRAEYFCGPGFEHRKSDCPDFTMTLERPNLPAEIVDQFNRNARSNEAVIEAQNQARQAEERARGERLAQQASQAALTPEYLRFKEIEAMQACAESANCTLVFTPGNTNVNVGTRAQ